MTIVTDISRFYNLRKHSGEFGLEIETEAKAVYTVPQFSFWDAHVDNSLRGPMPREYVLKAPLKFSGLPEALKEFEEKTKDAKFIQDSITTSIHVHINMLNETWLTFGNFLTVYTLVENLLMRYSGEDRKGNMFCLPMCDAEETYRTILHMLRNIEAKNFNMLQLDRETTKYAALNLGCLTTLGSLEQRSFRGVTDIKLIQKWIAILNSILVYARQQQTPIDFITNWKNRGPEVLTDVFGEFRKDIRVKDEDELLEKNFWYAVNIANCLKGDWKKLDAAPKPKKVKTTDLDLIAMKRYATSFERLTEPQKREVMRELQFQKEENEQAVTGQGPGVAGWVEEPIFTERDERGRVRRIDNLNFNTTRPVAPPMPEFMEDDPDF